MNLSEKSFTVSSLESDLTAMRKDVNKLQGEINKLDKLLKEMYKTKPEEFIPLGIRQDFEAAKQAALGLTKAQFKQFLQDGSMQDLIGGSNERQSRTSIIDNGHSGDSSAIEQPVNGLEEKHA
jgi:hypothetical protein